MNIEISNDHSANDFIVGYLSLMDQLISWNHQNTLWQCSFLGTKPRFSSPFAKILPELVTRMKQEPQDGSAMIFFPEVAGEFSIEYLPDGMRKLRLHHNFRTRLLKQLKQKRIQVNLFLQFLQVLRNVYKTRKRKKQKQKYQDVTCIIKSFTYKDSFNAEQQYCDPYFKELANLLSKHTKEIKIATIVEGADQSNFRNQQLLDSPEVIPVEMFLRLVDILKSFFSLAWKIVSQPFRIEGPLFLNEIDITPLVKEIFSTYRWHIPFWQSLYYNIGKNIVRAYPSLKSVMMTYEGNPWERMLMKGLQEENPNIHITGYQHSVVPQSALSMFMGKKEAKYMYQPDTLLTTGEIPKAIIEQYGDNSRQPVIAACALRYDHLYQVEHRLRLLDCEKIKILVAIEGLMEASFLLLYTISQAKLKPEIVFRVRAHPALPFSDLLHYSNYQGAFPDNLEISENCTVEEDLEGTDILLYWGTTIALEAILMGKPIIHLDRGDLLSFDPLFQLTSFKWVATPDQDLMIVINDIIKLSEQRYEYLSQQAKDYVLSYFHPITDRTIAPCIAQVL
jgi:surface carbohydrate biosynthesis protein (TIGR04326 family)